MRLWLNDDERRPDPVPARADARKAVVAGTAGWLLVLVACVVFREPIESAGFGWFTTAAVTGIVLGLIGVAVVLVSRRRHGQPTGRSSD